LGFAFDPFFFPDAALPFPALAAPRLRFFDFAPAPAAAAAAATGGGLT
jgi:hypothetical protein